MCQNNLSPISQMRRLFASYPTLPLCATQMFIIVLWGSAPMSESRPVCVNVTPAVCQTVHRGFPTPADRGVIPGVVTEIVGPSASGKTQLCLATAAAALAAGHRVVWLETCNSFSIHRLQAHLLANFRREAAEALVEQAQRTMGDDRENQTEEDFPDGVDEEGRLRHRMEAAMKCLRVVEVGEATQLVVAIGRLVEAVDRKVGALR